MNKIEQLCSKRKLNINTIKLLIKNNYLRNPDIIKNGLKKYINKIFDKYVDILEVKDIPIVKTLIKIINNKIYIRCLIPTDNTCNKIWIKILPFYFSNKSHKYLFNISDLSIIDQFHEAMEIKYSIEFINLYRFIKNDIFKCKFNGFEKINYHIDPRVLKEELKIVNYFSLFSETVDSLRNYRMWKGEYSNPRYDIGKYNSDKYGPTAMSSKLIKKRNKILSKRKKNSSWLYQFFSQPFNHYNSKIDYKSIF